MNTAKRVATIGEYPQAPPPRVAPQFACTHKGCLEDGVAYLQIDGTWRAGPCEKHFRGWR